MVRPAAEKSSMRSTALPGLVVIPVALLLASGCKPDEDVVGHYWAIQAKGVELSDRFADKQRCIDGGLESSAEFEYRVMYDGNDFDLAIGPDVFASGSTSGCYIAYESIRWTEERNGYNITWRILGEAQARHGGRNCNAESDWDWEGIERFVVVKSEDPSIAPGCEYHMKLEGMYVDEVQ